MQEKKIPLTLEEIALSNEKIAEQLERKTEILREKFKLQLEKIGNDNMVKAFPFKKLSDLEIFSMYVDENIIDPYLDFSYLFHRLLNEKLIFPLSQKKFFIFLLEKGFIIEKNYKSFCEKGQFYSFSKCSSTPRENNFNNLFGL